MNTLIIITDILEKLILLTLAGLSVWSISIIIERRRAIQLEKTADLNKLKTLISQKQWSEAQALTNDQPLFVYKAINAALHANSSIESIERSVSSFVKQEKQQLERGLSVLGTLGANAPFIGLFGTVLGIIRAFAYLGSQSGSQAVMSGVSQALYATAVGLFVAIPAVIAFNYFTKQIKDLSQATDSLKDLYIAKKF